MAACEKGGSLIDRGGPESRLAGEQLAVVAVTRICTGIDHIEVVEVSTVCQCAIPSYVLIGPRFRRRPEASTRTIRHWGPAVPLNGMYTEVLARHGRSSWDDPGSRRHGAPRLSGLDGPAVRPRLIPREHSVTSTGGGRASWTVCRGSRCRSTGTLERLTSTTHTRRWRSTSRPTGVVLPLDVEKREGDTPDFGRADRRRRRGDQCDPIVCAAPPG